MSSINANRAVPEIVDHAGVRVPGYTSAGVEITPRPGTVVLAAAASAPTQIRRPWRSTLRTTWQAFLGLCVLAPILVTTAGLDPADLPWLGVVLAVAAAVTRVMAIPGVEAWLRQFLPFLAAAPRPPD